MANIPNPLRQRIDAELLKGVWYQKTDGTTERVLLTQIKNKALMVFIGNKWITPRGEDKVIDSKGRNLLD
jgi:hypothetical protein